MDHDLTLHTGTSRRLRDWLHETAEDLPDDPTLFGGIKASLRNPQPRPWAGLFRSGTGRLVAASVLATVAVVAIGLAFREPAPDHRFPAVGGAPSASPMLLPEGTVPPGRSSFARDVAPLMERYDVSMDIPAGWSNDNGGWVLTKPHGDPPDGATVEVEVLDRIYVDPCHPEAGKVDVPPSSSPESLAAILTSWGSDTGLRTATSPTTTEPVFGTYDGRPGVELTVLTPADVVEASCTDGHYTLWGDAIGGRYIQGPGESFRVRAIEVGSELLILAAGSFPETPAELLAEQQAMLDSVRIVPRTTSSPSPVPSLATLKKISSDDPPGRYRVDPRWLALEDGSEVSVEVAPGWLTWNGTIVDMARTAGLDLWAIDRVYADPCTRDRFADDRPWTSLDRFARALAAWSTADSRTKPVVTEARFGGFGGFPGFELTASIPADLDLGDCGKGELLLWRYIDGDERAAEPGDELLIRVIDGHAPNDAAIPGTDPRRSGLIFVVATTGPGTPLEVREQLLAMVDSIRITPVTSAASAVHAMP